MAQPEPLAPWLARQLQALMPMRGHALLLAGPAGLGQFELAQALARAWLCDAPAPHSACGVCPSCHGCAVHAHTDLRVLLPEELALELGWPLDESVQQDLDKRKRKPSREIRIDAVRDLLTFAQRSSGRGRGRVALIHPADRMNPVSANALLKTLEEPPGDLRLLLSTESLQQLPATIVSRCQRHAMAWPSHGEALAWLAAQGVGGAQSEALLRWTGGRPHAALALARQGQQDPADALLTAVQQADAQPVSTWTAPDLYDGLLKLCHDCMAVGAGAPPRFWPAAAVQPSPPMPVLSDWFRELCDGARHALHAHQPGLLMDALVARAHERLHSTAS